MGELQKEAACQPRGGTDRPLVFCGMLLTLGYSFGRIVACLRLIHARENRHSDFYLCPALAERFRQKPGDIILGAYGSGRPSCKQSVEDSRSPGVTACFAKVGLSRYQVLQLQRMSPLTGRTASPTPVVQWQLAADTDRSWE